MNASGLAGLWKALVNHTRLEEVAEISRGFSVSDGPDRPVLGGAEAERSLQFCLPDPTAARGGVEGSLRCAAPAEGEAEIGKVLFQAVHDGSAWPVKAFTDFSSLGATPDFFAIVPRYKIVPAVVIEAILNGPVANAFFTEFRSSEPSKSMVGRVPLPYKTDFAGIIEAVRRHKELLGEAINAATRSESLTAALKDSLVRVDAAVLKQYDLAPSLEKDLLRAFVPRNAERRVGFEFSTWWHDGYTGGFRLHDYVDPSFQKSKGPWILDAIKPLSEKEWEEVSRWLP